MPIQVTMGKSLFDKQQEITDLQHEKEYQLQKIKEMNKELDLQRKKALDADRIIKDLKAQVKALEDENSRNNLSISDGQRQIKDLRYRISTLERDKEALESRVRLVESENRQMKEDKKIYLEKNYELTHTNKTLREKNIKVVDKLSNEVGDKKGLLDEIETLNGKIFEKDKFIAVLIKERNMRKEEKPIESMEKTIKTAEPVKKVPRTLKTKVDLDNEDKKVKEELELLKKENEKLRDDNYYLMTKLKTKNKKS